MDRAGIARDTVRVAGRAQAQRIRHALVLESDRRSDPGRGHSRDVGPLCATVFWTTCGCDRSQCAVRGQALPEGQPAADRADDRVLRLRCVRRHGSRICPDLGRDRLAARPVARGAPRGPSPACRLWGRRRDSRSFRGAARRCLLRLRGGTGNLYGQRSRPGRHQRADGQPHSAEFRGIHLSDPPRFARHHRGRRSRPHPGDRGPVFAWPASFSCLRWRAAKRSSSA